MAKRRSKIDSGRSCPLYPVGRSDAKMRFAGFAGTKSSVCVSPDSCPPDSKFPEYHQVIQVRRKARTPSFTSSCNIFDYFKNLKHKPSEAFYAVGLDNKNRVTVINKVADGGVDSASVDRRTLFAPLIAAGSARFVLIHNHPSGELRPSPEDHALTEDVAKAGKLLGMALLDHLVIGESVTGGANYVSFRDAGMLRE